jgi:hypothetical protein
MHLRAGPGRPSICTWLCKNCQAQPQVDSTAVVMVVDPTRVLPAHALHKREPCTYHNTSFLMGRLQARHVLAGQLAYAGGRAVGPYCSVQTPQFVTSSWLLAKSFPSFACGFANCNPVRYMCRISQPYSKFPNYPIVIQAHNSNV